MIKRQILTIEVLYDDAERQAPEQWDWSSMSLQDTGAEMKVLAASRPEEADNFRQVLAEQLQAWSRLLSGYSDPTINGVCAGMDEVARDIAEE